jgi:hypothetical protein
MAGKRLRWRLSTTASLETARPRGATVARRRARPHGAAHLRGVPREGRTPSVACRERDRGVSAACRRTGVRDVPPCLSLSLFSLSYLADGAAHLLEEEGELGVALHAAAAHLPPQTSTHALVSRAAQAYATQTDRIHLLKRTRNHLSQTPPPPHTHPLTPQHTLLAGGIPRPLPRQSTPLNPHPLTQAFTHSLSHPARRGAAMIHRHTDTHTHARARPSRRHSETPAQSRPSFDSLLPPIQMSPFTHAQSLFLSLFFS